MSADTGLTAHVISFSHTCPSTIFGKNIDYRPTLIGNEITCVGLATIQDIAMSSAYMVTLLWRTMLAAPAVDVNQEQQRRSQNRPLWNPGDNMKCLWLTSSQYYRLWTIGQIICNPFKKKRFNLYWRKLLTIWLWWTLSNALLRS